VVCVFGAQNDTVEVRVAEDDGIGSRRAIRIRSFAKFYRGAGAELSGRREWQRQGYGLVIARRPRDAMREGYRSSTRKGKKVRNCLRAARVCRGLINAPIGI